MDNFQIETAQNISISQNTAGVVDRILAFLLDALILLFYFIVLSFVISGLNFSPADQWVYLLLMGLPVFLYFLLWETFWDGRTPGKAALDLRVVKLDGSKPAFSGYLVRWLLRIIDITLTSGSVAVISILLSGKGQRLGDMAAGTTVITERKKVRLSDTLMVDLPENYQPSYPQVRVLSDRDVEDIKNLLFNSLKNSNYKVISSLSEKVSGLLEVQPREIPVDFLKKVILDYNYYTRS